MKQMNCRIGDLAVIVRPSLPANLGMVVEVIGRWPDDPRGWRVRSLSGPRLRGDGRVSSEGLVRDAALKPIRELKPAASRKAPRKAFSAVPRQLDLV